MSAAAHTETAGHRSRPRRPSPRRRQPAPARQPESAQPSPRRGSVTSLPFITLIAAVLGGGLLTLLMINNSLAAGSFVQARLKAEQVALFEQEQELNQEVQRLSSPTSLRGAARKLGMLPAASTAYFEVESGRVLGVPLPAGVSPAAEGGVADSSLPPTDPTATAPVSPQDAGVPAPTRVAGDGAAALTGGPAASGTGSPSGPGGDPAGSGDGAALTERQPQTAYDRAIVSGGVDQ